jgi:hypothetical protein
MDLMATLAQVSALSHVPVDDVIRVILAMEVTKPRS